MSSSPFPIGTPRDLLNKAKREIDELEKRAQGLLGKPDPAAIGDLTWNAACTLWHTTDWIVNSSDPELQAIVASKGCTTPDREERAQAFQRQLRSERRELEICWALALHFKHFELMPEHKAREVFDEEAYVSVPAGWPSAIPEMSGDEVPVAFSIVGAVRASSHFTTSTLHPKVTADGERLRLVNVYRSAYEYLDRMLRKHGL